ncbi:MAG: CSLREA domain-containing protein, partial [Ilumatobacter sp.]|nr:CSLREA domain-containing protein [Ilumatobacter sp.]
MGSGGRRRRAAIAAGFAVSAIPIAVAIDSTPAGAVSITVTTTFDTAGDDGQCSLREAITAANTNSPSGAAPGECPAGSSTATDTITLAQNTTYDVAPTTNLPDISDDLVIDGNGSTIDSRKTLRVLSIAPGVTAEIDDLTLTHRYSATSVTGRGLINRGITTLRNVTIVDNSEVGFGGGIFNGDDVTGTAADLTIIDSTIENNANIPDGNRVGGGIHNHDRATLTIENSTIRNNTADRTGGGISHRGTHLQIEDSVIEGNRAGTGGGVGVFASPIVVAVPTATLTGVTIVNNEATGGGGIAAIESTVSISQSSVLGNRADHDGGGLFLSQSNALLDTVVIA